MGKRIIDVCCGSKMFWFDKNNPDVEFCDIRTVENQEYYSRRYIEILPDTVCSECGETYDTEPNTFDAFCTFYRYCPICGARMDGGEENA